VIVAEPFPLVDSPRNSDVGIVSVPVMVFEPPVRVIVNGTVTFVEVRLRLATGTETLNVPFPMPLLRVAGPVAVRFVPRATAALVTVRVVVVVAAFAMAPAKIARAHVFMILFNL
jgi:hypothetical protein